MRPDQVTVQASVDVSSVPRASIVKGVILAFFAMAIVAFSYFDLKQYLSIEALKGNRDSLLAFPSCITR